MLPFLIIILPFIGTTLGSAAVFFCKKDLSALLKKLMLGFAAGVMIAASIWSLILPSIELAAKQNVLSFLPATIGFIIGIVFLMVTENIVSSNLFKKHEAVKSIKTFSDDFMLFLAVTLHNIPEGMAVGVAVAGTLGAKSEITLAAAMALSFGISVQNFPEGAIISLPLLSHNTGKFKAFIYGALSGIVEPIAAVLTIIFVSKIVALLPLLLSFAAGAMFYVTVEDLIPECKADTKGGLTAMVFSVGFLLMMILDVVFG